MKDWLKKRKRDMRREFSVFLVLVLALTGIPFPVRAGKGQDTASDGWKVDCAWSVLSYDDFWEAETDSMKQPKMVVTYRMDHAPRDYVPGEIQFIIPGIGNLNRSSILKASKLASDEEDSEWRRDSRFPAVFSCSGRLNPDFLKADMLRRENRCFKFRGRKQWS